MNTTKNGKATTAPATSWHVGYDATIKAAKGTLGPAVPDAAYAAAPLLGKGKRTSGDAAEALMIALVFRAGGVTSKQYQAIRQAAGLSNNCIAYLQAPGVHARGIYGHITVTQINGAYCASLTAKGAAHLKAAGMNARDVATLSKPVKAPAPVKADKPVKPRKPAVRKPQPAKPAPAPVAAKPATPTVNAPQGNGNKPAPQA